jgi:2-polyprenyl-3-methyl-5-hydroxy-6-metoxy-1,4-benzoquinol methylase
MIKQNFDQQYFNFAGKLTAKQVVETTIEEILKIAEAKLHKKAKYLKVLDVGSGYGLYSNELSKYVKKVVGVEPFKEAYEYSVKHKIEGKNITFHNVLMEDFATNERFDLAISLTTIEHMPKAELAMHRVMKHLETPGILYLTAPNKLWPYESHYALLFLSWLPLPLANIYLRMSGRGTSYEDASYSKTYFGLKRMVKKLSDKYEFVLPSPDAKYLGCGSSNGKSVRRIGIWLIKRVPLFWTISKGFIVIVERKLGGPKSRETFWAQL